jgi:acyl-CoA thioester hydrolase
VAPPDRFVSENTFYVRYAETDAMAVVHHASHIVYFEEARCHYMRVKGANYADLERSGYWLTVVEIHARYISPARYGRQLTVRCWIEELKRRALTFGSEIVDAETRQVHVTGYSRHICINHSGQVCTIPESWAAIMGEGLPG